MALTRKIFILGPLMLAACATPELPGGFEEEQSWFDTRVERGASADNVPAAIPDKRPSISTEQLRQSAGEVLEARDEVSADERAIRESDSDTEAFADAARQRAEPPPHID